MIIIRVLLNLGLIRKFRDWRNGSVVECWLLFQGTTMWFPTPTLGDSEPLGTPDPQNLMSSPVSSAIHTHVTDTQTYAYT